jgi:carbonic anhydrase/acetyltransferase-like protein (isoleucine patch superfamily)
MLGMTSANPTPALRPHGDHQPQLGQRVWIDPQATVIGQVQLGDDVSVWPQAVLRGDVNRIEIGAQTNIQDGVVCHVTHDGPYTPGGFPLVVGEQVTVGHGAIIHACTIGHRCLIGMGAIVLDGAVIEDEVMVGAGALVSPGKRLAGGWLYVGQPARPVRPLTPEQMEALRYSAEHYVRVKQRYLEAG